MNKSPITLIGYKKLFKKLQYLKTIKRFKIIKNIFNARRYGDLKENHEYKAAKEQQIFCEKLIQEIKIKLCNSKIINIKNLNYSNIVFGSTVELINCKLKKKFTIRIVGDDEVNFKKKLISINSPIAKVLIGKKIGNNVTVKLSSGNIKYKILNIK